ncbi:class I SAM-dependent methyltransferase [Elusimicrobiota bacterium]
MELHQHYNKKYVKSDYKEVKPVIVKGYPKNRYEAAVSVSGKGDSFLEIGCGSGSVMLTFKDYYKRCVGVELSDIRADEMKKLFNGCNNVDIVTGNIEDKNLDMQAETFDTILVNAVVEHLVTPIPTLEYLCALLKKGGRIIIITPNIAKWTRRIKLLLGYFPSTASFDEGLLRYDKKTKTDLYDDGHLHYFTYRSMKKILIERVGLSKVDCRGFGRPSVLTRLFPKLFSDCFVVGIK